MKEKDKTLRKRTKQSGDKQSFWWRAQGNDHKELNKFGGRMNKHSENLNKELENMKNQIELKNTITKIKNTLKKKINRLDGREEWISNLEDRVAEITQAEQKKKKEF